jgi:hypothetical protein
MLYRMEAPEIRKPSVPILHPHIDQTMIKISQ